MQAYSQDLRERVLRALDRGERPSEIARRFEVGRVWVYQVRERLEKTGERGSFQIGGPPPVATGRDGAAAAGLDQRGTRSDLDADAGAVGKTGGPDQNRGLVAPVESMEADP